MNHAVLDTLASLVSINSVNPAWNGPGEGAVAHYVSRFFEQLGLETWTREVLPNRPNVYAKLPGRDPSRRIVFEAHMDTVSVEGMEIPPFKPRVDKGMLWGRGACDVKAGVAAMMHALSALKKAGNPPPCDVWFAAVVDEEHLYRGVLSLIDELSQFPIPKTVAVVAEPTECRIATANKGVLRWTIHTVGKSAHSSKPDLGHNAITDMMRVIQALEADAEGLSKLRHPLVGSPTLCISMIEGGTQINFVPDRCSVSVDRRLIPSESAKSVVENYARLLKELQGVTLAIDAPMVLDEAMETSESEDVVHAAKRAAAKLGIDGSSCGVPFGCDVTKLSRAGIPGIIFGPGSIARAHSAIEYVEIDQVVLAAEFYRTFIEEFAT